MGDLLNKWRSAKKLFKDTAKVKKPSSKVTLFFNKTAGIEKTLIKLEAAQAKGINDNAKAFAAWKAAALDFRVAKTNYLLVLDGTIGKEPAGADKNAYRKGVAVLKTHLNAIDKTIKVLTTTAQDRQAGVTNALTLTANSLMDQIEAACSNAEAFIARVKATPTPEAFNGGIQTAARDITQNVGNIKKLTARGYVFTKTEPHKLFVSLTAWADKGREVKPDANVPDVLAELAKFETCVAGIRTWAA